MTNRTAIYPGTFDPVTHGHMDIIRRSLRVADRLVVGVALDTGKSHFFSPKVRAKMIESALSELSPEEQARISVKTFGGLLVEFAKKNDAVLLIRGLRAVSDFEYEFQMAAINARMNNEIETVFLTASETTHFISSRFIKQICQLGGDISPFVPKSVAPQLVDYFKTHP